MINADNYPVVIQPLLADEVFNGYLSGQVDQDRRSLLAKIQTRDLFEKPIVNASMAQCCHSGLWLLLNCLDESHEISQSVKTCEGSYWHGLMHWHEGDIWNSKYWLKQVGEHPTDHEVSRFVAAQFDNVAELERLAECFQPSSFVDVFQRATDGEAKLACLQIARRQWAALFQFCFEMAT